MIVFQSISTCLPEREREGERKKMIVERKNGCVRFATKRHTPMPRLRLLDAERFVYRLTPDYSDHMTGQTSCSSEKSATGEYRKMATPLAITACTAIIVAVTEFFFILKRKRFLLKFYWWPVVSPLQCKK